MRTGNEPPAPRWRYPQTILQLYRHLEACGYPADRLARVRDAYELATSLFTSRFAFPGGKPLLDHCIGTAGILASLEAAPDVVVAGLLHNAYEVGDFGDGGEGSSPARRAELRRSVGARAEAVIGRFAKLRFQPDALVRMGTDTASLDADGRDALLIWVVDHLEHHLDLGVLHVGGDRSAESSPEQRTTALRIAEGLGRPLLVAELRRAYRETDEGFVADLAYRGGGYVVEPRSYRLRPWIRLSRLVRRMKRRRTA